ncbi:MAG: carboxymuconolactone decarboxylase family protein [Trebonia sp.]
MARIPPASDTGEIAERIRQRRPGGVLRPIDEVLLHTPEIAGGWNSLLGSIRRGAGLPADLRELVILRIAVLNDAPYEWESHEAEARAAGLRPDQLAALRGSRPADAAVFSTAQRSALRLADAMTREIGVPDELFGDLRALFGPPELVELVVVVAAYNMVSRLVVALGVRSREETP